MQLTSLDWTIVFVSTVISFLQRFYRKVRPAGPGWAAVRRASGDLPSSDNLTLALVGSITGCTFVFSALFGTGHILLGHQMAAIVSVSLFAVSGVVLYKLLPHVWGR